jgi:predicted O-linked N-acetylglucosamine transferase (SPINDLY family)
MQSIISEDGLKEVNVIMSNIITMYKAKDYDKALEILLPLSKKYPNLAEPLHFISVIYTQRNNYETALEYMEKSIKCLNGQTDRNYFNKGVCLFRLNKHSEAITAFETTTKINPNHMEAYENIVRISKDPEQIQKYGKICIKKKSKCADVYFRTGSMRDPFHYYYDNIEIYLEYFRLKVSDIDYKVLEKRNLDSLEFNKTVLRCAINSGQPKIAMDLLLCTPSIYYSEEQLDHLRDRFSKNIDFLMENLPKNFFPSVAHLVSVINHSSYSFYLSYQNRSNSKLFAKLCAFYRHACESINYVAPHCHKLIKQHKKIRIAFLSNFLSKNHSVCRDRMGIIERLPRDIFEIYYIIYEKPSSVLGIKLWNSTENRIIIPQNDINKSSQMIEDLKLDILIYCEIAMDPIAYYLSFKRLAPIQCNTWGHSDTSGIDTIDYFMSSKYFELDNYDDAQEHYSEKLITMDSLCTYYYNPADFIPKDQEYLTRYEMGVSTEVNMYVCIQSTYKLYPSFDYIINEILTRDPKGQLFLLEQFSLKPQWMSRMEKVLKHNMNRVHILGRQEFIKYMSYLKQADAIIDPYPFGGCNSSFEAFSLGQGVVTMPGDFINGRFTHGFYKKMGILDLVANTKEEYIDIAIRCANDKVWRKSVYDRIMEKKNLLFEEQNSVKTWTQTLLDIYIKKLKEDADKPDISTSLILKSSPPIILDIDDNKEVKFEITEKDIKKNKELNRFSKMKGNVFWTVIMPMHNRDKYIRIGIMSILAQAPIKGNMEILFLDDHSETYVAVRDIISDILDKVTKKQKKDILRTIKFRYEYHNTNLGEFSNTNYGLKKASGKWVHILHDDDWMNLGFYNKMQSELYNKDNIGYCCSRFNNTDIDGKITWESPKLQDNIGIIDNFIERVAIANPLHLHAVVFRKQVFDEIGLFRDDIRFYADWEFYKRTYKSKYKWYYIPETYANYRMHDKSESALRDSMNLTDNRFWKAIDSSDYLPADLIKSSREYHCTRYLQMANNKYSENKHLEAIYIIQNVLANNNINNSDVINNTLRDHCKKLDIGFVEHVHIPKISIDNFESKNRKYGISGFMKINNEGEFLDIVIDSWIPYLDELVIVYNQCTDNTPKIIQKYADKYLTKIKAFHYIPEVYRIGTKEHKESNVNSINNFAHYVNFALSRTTYQVCVLVDGDDIAIPNNLKHVTDYIRNNKISNEALIYSGVNLYSDDDNSKLFASENNLFAGDGDHTFFTVSPNNRYFKTDRWEFLNKRGLDHSYLGFMYYHAKYLKNDKGFGHSGDNDKELNALIQHQTYNVKQIELETLLNSDKNKDWMNNIPKHTVYHDLKSLPIISHVKDILNDIIDNVLDIDEDMEKNISCNIKKVDEENKIIKVGNLVKRTDEEITDHNKFVFNNYQQDKKFILSFPSWHKQDNNELYLLIQYYIPDSIDRSKELNKCLFNNLMNDAFTELHIFTETQIDFKKILTEYNSDITDKYINKIKQIVINKRLTYKIAFNYINTHLTNKTCTLSNTDIYFDNTINYIFDINLTNIVFAMTRYDVDNDGYSKIFTHTGRFGNPCIDSQDVWVFQSPLPDNLINNNDCDFELGQWGCDNSIAAILYKSGLEILNPCKTIKTYHLDLTETRAHNEDHKVKREYMYLLQCELKTETTIKYDKYNNDKLTIYKYKDDEVQWQQPVITEEDSYNWIKNSNIEGNYLAIPWATLLDKYTDRSKDGIFPDTQYNNLNLIKDLHFLELKDGITVCQHIYFKKIIPLLKKIGINTLFTPHVSTSDIFEDITVLPYPLYPINKSYNTEIKDILYSFVGTYSDNYLSDVRKRIFDMKHPDSTVIIKRDVWHYENNVYHNQIFNFNRTTENIEIDTNKETEYQNILGRSRYSLTPSGTGVNSIRFWESLCSGAIPILLSDDLVLPNLKYYNLPFNWSDCIIQVPENDIENLITYINDITNDNEALMRKQCIQIGNLFSHSNIINPIKSYTKKIKIISYCCDKYPNSFGGVPRFDYQLSLVYPDRVWFGPKQKNDLLIFLENNPNTIIITDNHLVCDIPSKYPAIVVHHGCARTHADRDPYWDETIKNYIIKGQDEIFEMRNPDNTWFISISQFCSDEFSTHYKKKYSKYTQHKIINSSELKEDNFKISLNNRDKPIIIGNWSDYNKGSKIIQKLARKLKNEFIFKNIRIPNMTDIYQHNHLKSEFYKDADIYLCLSLSEGSSYALLDSLITNLLVVGTNVGLMYNDLPDDVATRINWERRDDVDYIANILRNTWKNRNTDFNKTRDWYINNNSFSKWKTEFTNTIDLFSNKYFQTNQNVLQNVVSDNNNILENKVVYFYIDELGDSADSANYQHPIISLAEGLKNLGIKFESNVNYWKVDGEYLFKKSNYNLEDVYKYDIVVTKFNNILPEFFSKKHSTIVKVMLDWSDGYNTYINKYKDIFDVYYKCSYNSNLNRDLGNVFPCGFQITNRFINSIKNVKWEDKKHRIVISHRIEHQVRTFFYDNFYKRLNVPVHIINDDFAKLDDNMQNKDSLWYQSGRRHNQMYFDTLSDSQICDCTGGFFAQEKNNKNNISIYQWDSLKIWEAFVAGCVVITADFDRFGCKLPILPINGVHYIGLNNSHGTIETLIKQLNNNELNLEKIAYEGRKWALENYSPNAFANRFIDNINDCSISNKKYICNYGVKQESFIRKNPNNIRDINYVFKNHNKNHTPIAWDNVNTFEGVTEHVSIIKDVIISNNGIIYKDAEIINDPNNFKDHILLSKTNHIVHIDKLVNIVQKWGYGYYHWMTEQLPKIIQVINYNRDINMTVSNLKFLVYNTPFVRESLHLLGINDSQIIAYNNSSNYVVKECIFTNNIQGGNPSKENITNIRNIYDVNTDISKIDEDSKCCILIKRHGPRSIKNFNSLFNNLKRSFPDKSWVVYDSMSFEETISLFSRAELVIGSHGAGLSNIIFSPNNIPVIEFVSSTDPNVCYWHLSSILNNNYWMIPIDYKQDCVNFDVPLNEVIETITPYSVKKSHNTLDDSFMLVDDEISTFKIGLILDELFDHFNNKINIIPKLAKSFLKVFDDTKMYYMNPLKGPHRFIEFPVLFEKISHLKGDILEIGAHKGECTRILLEYAKICNKKVYVIDPWCGDQQGNEQIYQNYFIPNTQEYDNLIVCREKSNSLEAIKFMENLNICFSFIDGLHTYNALDCDIKHVKNCHKNGGIIVVDDVRGVDTHNAQTLMKCVDDNIIDDGWVHKKSPDNYLHTFLIK